MSWWVSPRPRVAARFAAARDRRLTVVTARTGYGKTTALAALDPDYWFDLTRADRDVSLLANRLAAALGMPGGGAAAAATGPDDPEEFAEARAGEVCAALADLDGATIVFDGADTLGRSAAEPAWRFLNTLVVQAPAGAHIVLSGQRMPPNRVLSESGPDAGQIGEADLAVTAEEIGELISEGRTGPGSMADACLSVTEGWPAAVALAVERLRRDGGEAEVRAAGSARWRSLARAVVAEASPDVREILRATALLGAIDERLLADLGEESGIGRPAGSLELLRERGVLIPEGRTGYLRLSPVLDGTVPAADQPERLRSRAADSFERAGEWQRALSQHLQIGPPSVRRFLRERGPELVDAYLARPVCEALRSAGTDGDLDLEMLRGRALQAAGDLDRAADVLHSAEERSPDRQLPAAIAWRYASLMYWRGPTQAALDALVAAAPATNAVDEALIAAWRGSCLWAIGHPADAQTWTERALTLAQQSQDATALAVAHTAHGLVAGALGDPASNQLEQRLALPWAIEAGDRIHEARARSNLAAWAADAGDYELSAAEVDRAVLAARGYTVVTGHALGNRASVLNLLGRLDEAREASAEAVEHFARAAPSFSCAALLDVAYVDRERGDLVRAQLGAERALRQAEEISDAHTATNARAFLARTIAADDPGSARALAALAIELASEQERAAALAAAAWVELVDRHPDVAVGYAESAEAAAVVSNDVAELASATVLTALVADPPDIARLEQALARWRALGNVVEVIRCRLTIARCTGDLGEQRSAEAELTARGLAVDAGICALPLQGVSRLPDLRILTLGTFQVVRGQDVVRVTEWQSRKARELLQLLIARRGQPIGREGLAEILWPDESGGPVGNRLSVLLSTVRRVLDPDRAYEADYFVRAEDTGVALRIERMRIDVIELFDAVREGLRLLSDGHPGQGEAVLRHAEQLYRGEFLPDNPYADWAVDCRSEALDAAQTLLRQLARTEVDRGDDEAALDHLRRLLERDRYDEQAWVALISALMRLRRHGEARRQHVRYARSMEELDVVPVSIGDLLGAA